MRILLMRHGLSEGNLDESLYSKQGDCNIELADEGERQSIAAGQFLTPYLRKTQTQDWPVFYYSDYVRTRQTLGGIFDGMGDAFAGEPKLYTDYRLIERFFGVLSELYYPQDTDDKELFATLLDLSKRVRKRDPFSAAPLMGESTRSTLGLTKSFIDGSFARDIDQGMDDFVFVTHGAVIRSFLANWFHVEPSDFDSIKNPGNCDIIEITGEKSNWVARKIYDGQRMAPDNRIILDHVRHVTRDDFPVPAAWDERGLA